MARVTRNYSAGSKPVVIPAYEEVQARGKSEPMTDEELQWWLGFQAGELQRAGKPVQNYEALASPTKPRRELEHRGREGA